VYSVWECIQLDLGKDSGSERVDRVWREVYGRSARFPVSKVPSKNIEEKRDGDQTDWDAN